MSGVAVGDEVMIDNSVYLASQTYHRHQYTPDYLPWEQFQVAGQPDLSAAAVPPRPAVRTSGRGLDPVGPVRREDDHRQLPHGRGRVRVWVGRVPEARRGRARRSHRRPVPPLVRRPHAAHRPGRDARRAATGRHHARRELRGRVAAGAARRRRRGSSAGSRRRRAPSSRCDDCQIVRRRDGRRAAGHPAGGDRDRERRVRAPTSRSASRSGSTRSSRCRPAPARWSRAEWDFDGAGEYPVRRVALRRLRDRVSRSRRRTRSPSRAPTSPRCGSRRTARATSTSPFARVQNLGRVRVVVSLATALSSTSSPLLFRLEAHRPRDPSRGSSCVGSNR